MYIIKTKSAFSLRAYLIGFFMIFHVTQPIIETNPFSRIILELLLLWKIGSQVQPALGLMRVKLKEIHLRLKKRIWLMRGGTYFFPNRFTFLSYI